jgi:hypothetical protein
MGIVAGICAMVWPIVDLAFYIAYPAAAGGVLGSPADDPSGYATQLAELGKNPKVLALEWLHLTLPLLLLPVILALYRLLTQHNQPDLMWLAASTGLVSIVLAVLGESMNATLHHSLGQSYVTATGEAERSAIWATMRAILAWQRGLNQVSSLLYQAFVGFSSASLLLARKWTGRAWMGIAGVALGLLARAMPGRIGMTGFVWTGLTSYAWPVCIGVGLLYAGRSDEAPSSP